MSGCISTSDIHEAPAFHIDGLIRGGDLVPATAMSIDDAIASHNQSLADVDAEWLAAGGDVMATLSARFETVEVEIDSLS